MSHLDIPKTNWTPYEDEQVRKHYGRLRPQEIGEKIGRTKWAVRHRAKALGCRAPCRWLPWADAELVRLYGTMKVKDIGALFNRDPDAVSARASMLNLIPPPKTKPSRARYVQILKEECDAANVDLNEALSDRQFRRIARVRWRAWERLRALNCSYPGIGMVANRDHTTIIAGIRREQQLRQKESRMA